MNINKERLAFLLKAYIAHNISDDELEELTKYINNNGDDPALEELMQEFWGKMEPDHSLVIPKESMYQSITDHPLFKADRPAVHVLKPLFNWRTAFNYAASIFLILACGLGIYRYSVKNKVPATQFAKNSIAGRMIKPGSKRAVLTLADGSKMILQNAAKGMIVSQNGAIVVEDGGQLVYHNNHAGGNANVLAHNSVTTPRGGEYQLHLGDGTVVWLNSGSSITYPVAFNANERRVKISGEAYFEVAKNPKVPFVVEANGTEVKVLGTHFNVNAYADNNEVKTTLVEGSVKVSKNGEQALLRPDEQAISSNGLSRIQVTQVDAQESLAWKNGVFLFNNENIKNVMKVISRWYDIDVTYRGDVSNKTFGGTISRFENFEKLLKTLELTGAIHFKIEGRRVVVMP